MSVPFGDDTLTSSIHEVVSVENNDVVEVGSAVCSSDVDRDDVPVSYILRSVGIVPDVQWSSGGLDES